MFFVMYYVFTHNKLEHYSVGDQISSETLNNLGSVYNSDEMTIKNLNVTGKFNMLPTGSIIAWSGTDVPNGWALCNGTKNTPNLQGRFILGAGQSNGLTNRITGHVGGEENHILSVAEMPSHSHPIVSRADDDGWCKNPPCGFQSSDRFTDDKNANVNETTILSSISNTGGNQQHNNMPPFYVLAFIMKL
jgi:microcystin-dependent protein